MKNHKCGYMEEKYTFIPISRPNAQTYLTNHLSSSLVEILDIEDYQAQCKVKTKYGEKIVFISLPVKYIKER